MATELPYWGDPGHKLALYSDSHQYTAPRAEVVTVLRHTAVQVVVEVSGSVAERRFYRETGLAVGKADRDRLLELHEPCVQDAQAVAAFGLLTRKLDELGNPGFRDTNKTLRTRAQVLRQMREMRREIALAWDQMGANRDDLD